MMSTYNFSARHYLKSAIWLGFFILLFFNSYGQEYSVPKDPYPQNIVPPDPHATKFVRYGEYAVSRNTGVPNISIPIYSVQSLDLALPIALSYHASGVKVSEHASWVGLGWSLQTGGMVSRTLRGRPDEGAWGHLSEDEDGRLYYGIPDASSLDPTDGNDWNYLHRLLNNEADTEHDVFNFNLPGLSGRFYITGTISAPKVVVQPYNPNIKIEPEIVDHNIESFTITTADGFIYRFETYSTGSFRYGDAGTYSGGFNSTWYLTEMSSPYTTGVITFSYFDEKEEYFERIESEVLRVRGYDNTPIVDDSKSYVKHYNYNNVKYISEISFNGGRVEFNNSTCARLDGGPRLEVINIYRDGDPNPVKSFNLAYDYFYSSGGSLSKYNYRLKLESLQEIGKPAHFFSYYSENSLPPMDSRSQDYWGYHNGETNYTLVPEYPIQEGNSTIILGGAKRDPKLSSMDDGTLSSITYPTGGSTQFAYEMNSYYDNGNKNCGGLRIASITNYDQDGVTVLSKKEYDYNMPGSNNSSGKLNAPLSLPFSDGAFIQYQANYYAYTEPVTSQCRKVTDRLTIISAKPTHNLGAFAINPVTYRYVTETMTDGTTSINKSVYQYEHGEDEFLELAMIADFSIDKSWRRGQLLKESHYKESDDNDPVREVTYDYELISEIDVINEFKVGKVSYQADECVTCAGGCGDTQIDVDRYSMFNGTRKNYTEKIEWKRLRSKTEVQDGVTTITTFSYHPTYAHTNVIGVEQTGSDDKTRSSSIQYAEEVNNTTLKNSNILNVPLISQQYVNGNPTQGSRLSFATVDGYYVPSVFESKQGDSDYVMVSEIDHVDPVTGRQTQVHKRDGIHQSMIWSPDGNYVLAYAINAELNEIAFATFEVGNSEGGWVFSWGSTNSNQARFGNRSINNGSISKSDLPTQKYKIGFWAKSTTGDGTVSGSVSASIDHTDWKYYILETNSVNSVILTAGSTVYIDEPRLFPAGAQMTTYTYEPLIGVTSKTETNGKYALYNYDELERLRQINDQEDNILKKYSYNYRK